MYLDYSKRHRQWPSRSTDDGGIVVAVVLEDGSGRGWENHGARSARESSMQHSGDINAEVPNSE
jgi:hypothetical protein